MSPGAVMQLVIYDRTDSIDSINYNNYFSTYESYTKCFNSILQIQVSAAA